MPYKNHPPGNPFMLGKGQFYGWIVQRDGPLHGIYLFDQKGYQTYDTHSYKVQCIQKPQSLRIGFHIGIFIDTLHYITHLSTRY